MALGADEWFAWHVFDLLAEWNEEKEHVPKLEKVGVERHFTNRDELTAYWRERLFGR